MSDEERGKQLYDQEPDLHEDFGYKEWPFSDKGDLDDVPVPSGDACVKISDILGGASEHSGDFSFGGQADDLPAVPGLFVDGVGPVPVPLWEERAQKLIAKCAKSPFGHNMDTKMDESVRKSWQLTPDQVKFQNPQWQSGIDKMTVKIADRLGYQGIPLKCVLYKLLVYGEGGHFVKHQDTEKEDGMVATMVIQPPSLHEGGDLVVYRGGEVRHRHDFGKTAGTATFLPHYAVHYADAEHAVEKMTKGYRLALVYSVCLPSTMRHLERNPNKPMSGKLMETIETMTPGDNSFALLLSHEYTENSIAGYGAGALKGVDRARFRALEEANASVSSEKKLELWIVDLNHQVTFYGSYGDIGDWEEDRRDEKATWYTTSGLSVGVSDKVDVKFNILNPGRETRSQLWTKPFGSSDMHGYMGNEGPTKDSVYSRYAIVAWPVKEHLENALTFINLTVAFENLCALPSVEGEVLQVMMKQASAKLKKGNAKKRPHNTWNTFNELPVPVPLELFRLVLAFLQDSDDPALAKLFFGAFFRHLKEKTKAVPEVVTLLQKFEWRDVGQALLDALRGNDEESTLGVTLAIVSKLPHGDAQQAMLAFTAKLSDKALSSSKKLKELWAFVLHKGDDTTLQTISAKFMQMSPRLLKRAAKTFVQLLGDTSFSEDKKPVVESIVARRRDWLENQIRVLEKPFSWEMPVAEFPENGSVEAFLRGPEAETTTKGMMSFPTLSDAQNYSYKYSGGRYTFQCGRSLEMEAGEDEGEVFLTLSKTRRWYDDNREKLPQLKEELEELAI